MNNLPIIPDGLEIAEETDRFIQYKIPEGAFIDIYSERDRLLAIFSDVEITWTKTLTTVKCFKK